MIGSKYIYYVCFVILDQTNNIEKFVTFFHNHFEEIKMSMK